MEDINISLEEIDAFVFDFDGVLSESMQDNFKAWQVATSKYGLTIKEEDYFPLEGMPGKDVALNLFRIYGRTIDDFQQVVNLKEASYLKFHQKLNSQMSLHVLTY